MVYACMMEMKRYDVGQRRYDVKAHVGSMVALWKTHVDDLPQWPDGADPILRTLVNFEFLKEKYSSLGG